MIRNMLNSRSKTITSAAIIIASASLASRILGILRDRILASEFGAGGFLDIYFVAFRIPDTIYNLLVLGAISAGFIPVFLDCLGKNGKKRSWKMVNSLVNIMFFALIGITFVLFLFTPNIIRLLAPGFDAAQMHSAIGATRIMFLSPIFLGFSSIWGGVLQSMKQFFVYSLAPIFYNIGIIFGALFFVPYWGIYGLAFGVVFGAFLHMLIQLFAVQEQGYRYEFLHDWKDPDVWKIFRLMIPRSLALAVSQINLFVVTIFGSMIAVGSIAVFHLANNLQSFPLGIFGISLAVAAFPTFSEMISKNDTNGFVQNFAKTARQVLFLMIPASALLIVLRAQIVRVVLGAGAFGWEDTINTADALAVFSLSLFAQALIPLLARGFYAHHNTKTPFYVGLISVFLNIFLSYKFIASPFILEGFSPVVGLVLAYSISQIVNFALLWILLRMKVHSLQESQILSSVFKTSLATIALALVTHWLKYVVEPITGTITFVGIFLQGIIAGTIGIIVFILVSLLLKSKEMHSFVVVIKRRLFKDSEPLRGSIEEASE